VTANLAGLPPRTRLRLFAHRSGWPLALILPVVAIIVGLIYLPLLDAGRLSLTDKSLLRPSGDNVGLDNYRHAFTSSELWSIAYQTVVWAAVSVGGAAVLGVGAAVLLTSARRGRPIRGRGLIGALLLIPFVAPPVVVAYTWNYLYSLAGPLNGVVDAFFGAGPIAFVGDANAEFLHIGLPMWSLIQVGVWSGFPFFFLMSAAALTSVPVELLQAAAIDGAGAWNTFRLITLPLIAPVIEITVFLELMFRLGGLDLPFLLTGGGPLNRSNVWGVYIYQIGFEKFDVGYGAALGILLFLICMPFSIWYVRRARAQLREL
jgi:multiple sugar transport system permease protein